MGRDTAQEMLRQHARSFAGHTARQFLAGKAKTGTDLDAPDGQGRCRITSSVKDVGDNFERDESLVEVELARTVPDEFCNWMSISPSASVKSQSIRTL